MQLPLRDLARCFQGVAPALVATASRDGTPNVTYLSQVQIVDDRHVALSCQFFNKTKRNVLENGRATIELYDPVNFDAFRLELRFVREERTGPLFDSMSARIDAIASHTGMKGIFKLLSADVFEVLSLEKVEGHLEPEPVVPVEGPIFPVGGVFGELRLLQIVSDRISRASTLDALLNATLESLDELCGFTHSMILLADESRRQLEAIASRGYGASGIGAVVEVGDGLIGTVAESRQVLRMASVFSDLRYGRAVRTRVEETRGATRPEIPLPGLSDAGAQLAIPLVSRERLVGVLAVESRSALLFEDWHEAFLQVLGNQIAAGIERMMEEDDEDESAERIAPSPRAPSRPRRSFCFYRNDDCIFVDGEYLIRNVPGKILWKLLTQHQRDGRSEFTNKELRLDPGLGLPPVKDNLESRLILLRKRLESKCPDVRLVPVRRGRFALEVSCDLDLVERASA